MSKAESRPQSIPMQEAILKCRTALANANYKKFIGATAEILSLRSGGPIWNASYYVNSIVPLDISRPERNIREVRFTPWHDPRETNPNEKTGTFYIEGLGELSVVFTTGHDGYEAKDMELRLNNPDLPDQTRQFMQYLANFAHAASTRPAKQVH